MSKNQVPDLLLNLCVIAGTVQRAPEWRTLPSGASVTTFNLKVPNEVGRAEVIRVSWLDAPTSALDLEEGAEVLVSGRVRSYWAGRSIVDMACEAVVPLRLTTKVRKRLARAMATLQEVCP